MWCKKIQSLQTSCSNSLLNHVRLWLVVASLFPVSFIQCRRLNTPIDKVMLNKLHLNRHTPKAVLHSSLERAGLNYPSFQICQDQKRILTLLKHLWWDGTVRNDILVVLYVIQLVLWLCKPILEDVDTDVSYIRKSWIFHLRGRLHAMKWEMWWVKHQWSPPLQRFHD